ncbi:hypothetical protein DYB25_006137 [Aphanomyces astaci]|uniref:Uncharacterized protein n=1 Tax=Aphanomyces astaci TaxID=112090 RepID=A0A397ADY9_APHAT|nr:hypothetical protein DYB25_006137 [Aphanomyces astaci]
MLTWILNGLLNVLFLHGCIGVPPLGVHGPAWATVMSQYVQLIAFALWALIASPSWKFWGGWSLECIRRFPTFVASAMTTSWVWKTILDWACACAVLVFAASSSTMNATQTSTQAFFLVLFHCGRVFAQSIGDASVQAEGSNARVHATVVVLGALGVFSASVGLGGDRFVGFFLGTDPQVVDAFRSVEPAFLWALGLLTGSTVMQVWLLQGADEEFFHRVGHMCATAFVYAPLSYVMGVTWQWGFGGMWWSMVCSQVWTILALCWVTVRGTSSVQSLVDEESRSLLPLQRAPSQETSRQHRYGSTIQSHTRKTTTQLPLSTYRGHLSDYKVALSTQPSPDADSSPKETSRLLRPHDADLEGSCDKATTLIDPAALTPSRNDLTVAAVHDILDMDTLVPDMELCITTQGCLAIWREARVFLCMFPCVCFRFVVVQLILDTELIFVGHLGVPQLAGLGLVRFWVAIPFGFLYCSMRAVYVLGSKTRGNRPSAAGHWLQTALGFALVGTLAVSYYYVHVADLAHLAALDDVAISYAREFAPIVLLGLFPSLAMAAMDNFMRIQGIALPALVCATVACVLNIYLHFVFIYGAFGWSGWGFVGSPWATVTSLVTQVALYVAYTVLWKRYHVPYWSGWAWNSHRLHRYRLFWRVSVPLGGMVVVFSIACLIVGTIASYSPSPFTAPHRQLDDGGVGSERVGAWVISFCLFLLVLAVLLGVAEATKVRMLVYLTHGRPKLARQVLYVGLAYSTLIALVFASALFMYKSVVFRIWTNDAGILEQCVDVVRWIMLCLVLSSVRVVLASGLIVLKKRPMVLLAQCIDVWCVQVPGSFVLPLLLQFQHLSGFWIAVAMGECVHVLLLVYALCQVNGDDDQALVKSVKAAFALVNQTSSPFKAKRNERENSDYDIHLCDLTKPLTLSHVVTVNALCDAPPTVQFVVTADVAIDVLTGSLSDHNHTSVCGADAPQLHVETRSTNGCTLSHELATAFHEDGSSDDSNALKTGVSSVHSGHTKAGSTYGDTGITDTERDKYSSLLHIPVSTSLRGVHVADAQKLVPEAINVLEQIEVKLPLDNDSSTDVILLKPIRSVQAEVALLNETTSPQPPSDAGSDSSNDGTTGQVSESESGASSTSQRRRPKAAVPPSVQIETLGGVDISTLHFGKRSKKRRTREAKQSKRVSFSPSPRQRRPSAYGIQPSLD